MASEVLVEVLGILKTVFYLVFSSLVFVNNGGRALGARFFMTWHTLMLIEAKPARGYDLDLKSQCELWVVYGFRNLSRG